MRIDLSWSDFKSVCVTNKTLNTQYITITKDTISYYLIWASCEAVEYVTSIFITDPANSDQTDFEDNYKDESNQLTDIIRTKNSLTITGYANVTGTNQTILEYEVPSNKILYVTDISIGGSTIDCKAITVDDVTKWRSFHLASDSHFKTISTPLKLSAGKVIKIINLLATNGQHIANLIGVLVNA